MASRVDSPRQTIRGRLIKYILPAVALVLLASIGTAIWLSRTAQERLAFARAQETARAVASDVGREIYANHKLGEVLAVQMENNRTANRAEVMDQLRQLLAENPDLLGTYVGYEPNAFDSKDTEFVSQPGHDATGRFLPYWNKLTGKATLDPIVDMDKSEFYTLPKSTKAWTVLEPYLYEGVLLASFISPIVRDDQFLGIAGVDVSLEQLDQRIRGISVFDTGRALMVGKTGLLIGGGEKADVGKKKLTELSGDADQKVLAEIVRAIGAGKAGSAKVAALGPIRDAVLFYQPIATAGWGLITVVPSKEIYAPVTFLTRAQASIGLGALLLVAALISVLAGRLTRPITLLDKAAQGAAAGNLQAVAGIKSGDEVESLANSFNKMIESVTSKSAVEADSEKLQREILAFLSLMASASQGDFTVRAKVTDSVVGNIADSLNLMLGDVGAALRNAQETSNSVAHSAREIRGDAEALAAGASAQEQAIDSTRAVVGSLTKSLEDVSASARSAADSAARVESASSEGGGAVREVVEGMSRIRQNVVASAKRVKRLGERSMEVSSITTTIAEISAQTNMLALNASMEAARAGEQGRGFAVVADEVRKLAARAAQATKDIEALVGGIQDEVNTVSSAMEAQTSDVERESRIVATAGEALARIGEAAHQASQQVANISNLSQSQAQNAAEVLAAMNAVVDIARRARTSSDHTLGTSESLANLANELTDRLRRFRTPEGGGAS